MPLTRAQVENFVREFFRDHRLAAPPIGMRRRFGVTLAARKRLNLPRTITREALADQVAARLCRECVIRHKRHAWETMNNESYGKVHRPKWFRVTRADFDEWRKYVRGVVVHHFGKGDSLK